MTQKSAPNGVAHALRCIAACSLIAVITATIILASMGRLPFNESIAGTADGARALIESAAVHMIQVGEPALDKDRAMVYVRMAGRTCQFILLRAAESPVYGWRISEQACFAK